MGSQRLRAKIGEIAQRTNRPDSKAKVPALLGNPDKGLELREEVKARLKRSLARERRGVRGVPVAEVARKLGLIW